MKRGHISLIITLLVLLFSQPVLGYESVVTDTTEHHSDSQQETTHKEFNPGDFIFDHIGDSHEWHIMTIGKLHISIPLPILLYSRTRNSVFLFWSSKFHHGHESYKGFKLLTEGELKGKIVEVDSHDQILIESPLPLDFSIKKNVVGIIFSLILLIVIFISIARKYQAHPYTSPKGFHNLIETFILFVRDDIARPSIGEKGHTKFMPFLLSVFFFIWINNMLGLIPIFPAGANVTGNIAVTMGLALITLITILINANKHFWKEIVNPPGVPVFLKLPIPIMPVVEAASWIIKPGVLMIRLFANILAGHIIAMVLFSLIFIFGTVNIYFGYGISPIAILLTVFMTLLEFLVAFIQAFVFTMLSALFIGMATADHH